ncbi:hypothetical protein SAMN04487962_12530 [Marinobacter segnicrescens]|uniref:Uncharacterized protein n=1 Tax=Marinobacter segnicrescens TaxID=430453 RepID=A0A1I0H8I4_9GAMM|nr:hypothetical protein [Marinobacter segnicrescens]SET79940.1 hypothetical protein SAMN04487962_12530 [Marinobacter segnicrescens]
MQNLISFYSDSALTQRIKSQDWMIGLDSQVSGLSVVDGVGMPSSGVTISVDTSTKDIQIDDGLGNFTNFTPPSNGVWVMQFSAQKYVVLEVTDLAGLGSTNATMTGGFSYVKNNVLSDITAQEATSGDEETHTIYCKNESGSELPSISFYIEASQAGESYELSADGSAFDEYVSLADSLVYSNIAAGASVAIHVRRTVLALQGVAVSSAVASLRYYVEEPV